MGVLGFAAGASAQIDLNQFRPTETARGGFAVSNADDQGHLRFGIQLYADYSDDSLVFENNIGSTGSENAQIVHQQLTGQMILSLGLWDRLVVFAGLPYHFILKEDKGDDFTQSDAQMVPRPNGDSLGDFWTGARIRLFGESDDLFQMALQGTINVHTASLADDQQVYSGGANVGVHPELLMGFNIGGALSFERERWLPRSREPTACQPSVGRRAHVRFGCDHRGHPTTSSTLSLKVTVVRVLRSRPVPTVLQNVKRAQSRHSAASSTTIPKV